MTRLLARLAHERRLSNGNFGVQGGLDGNSNAAGDAGCPPGSPREGLNRTGGGVEMEKSVVAPFGGWQQGQPLF